MGGGNKFNLFENLKTAIVIGFIFGTISVFLEILISDPSFFKNINVLCSMILLYGICFIIILSILTIFLFKFKNFYLIKRLNLNSSLAFLNLNTWIGIFLTVSILLFYILNFKLLATLPIYSPARIFSLLIIFIAILIALYVVQKKQIYLIKNQHAPLLTNLAFAFLIFLIVGFSYNFYEFIHIPDTSGEISSSKSPNIMLIVLDAVRADHLGLYGYERDTTPILDVISESSVVFENAIAQSSWTGASHASMFTGHYPSIHGDTSGHPHLDDSALTMAELLSENGYNTMGIVGNPYCKYVFGLGQGFITYRDHLDLINFKFQSVIPGMINSFSGQNLYDFFDNFFFIDGEQSAEEINNQLFKWLNLNHKKPFFIFINYYDPHDPYLPKKPFNYKFTNNPYKVDLWGNPMFYKRFNDTQIAKYKPIADHIIDLYDSEISYTDYHIGKLFEKLGQLGILNNTIVVITADHGEEFLDHGGWQHGRTLYEEVIHVPLLIYYPKKLNPQNISEEVELLDLMPTLFEMINLSNEVPENISGVSLVPLINGKTNKTKAIIFSELIDRGSEHPDSAPFEKYSMEMIRNKKWKLIETTHSQYEDELFDLKSDPDEKVNLYKDYAEKRDNLQQSLVEFKDEDFKPVFSEDFSASEK